MAWRLSTVNPDFYFAWIIRLIISVVRVVRKILLKLQKSLLSQSEIPLKKLMIKAMKKALVQMQAGYTCPMHPKMVQQGHGIGKTAS